MSKDIVYKDLNPEQTQAVDTIDGYVRIIAGAGTGKTKTIVHRFLNMTEHHQVPQSKILLLSFSNKAVNELRYRINGTIKDRDGWICTYHSLCLRFLREEGHIIGLKPNFQIVSAPQQAAIIKKIRKDLNLDKEYTKDVINKIVLDYKTNDDNEIDYLRYLTNLTDLNETIRSTSLDIASAIVLRYIRYQHEYNALDFNDLITLTLYMLRNSRNIDSLTKVRNEWEKKFMYIIIDEYQDTSAKQNEIAQILSSRYNNLCVVGDESQCIYEWRNASVDTILNFPEIYKPCIDVILHTNYRSTQQILNVANKLIEHNKKRIPRTLIADNNKQGHKPIAYFPQSNKDEAEWICDEIQKLQNDGVEYKDVAILYRSERTTRMIQNELLRRRIPMRIHGSSFYEQEEIIAAISYLKLINDTDDNLAFDTIINYPSRKIGEATQNKISLKAEQLNCSKFDALSRNPKLGGKHAAKFVEIIQKYNKLLTEYNSLVDNDDIIEVSTNIIQNINDSNLNIDNFRESLQIGENISSVAMITASLFSEIGLCENDEEQLANVTELVNSIVVYEHRIGEPAHLSDFLDEISLLIDAAEHHEESEVNLMTCHSAKGTEYKYCFLPQFTENSFPSRKSVTEEDYEAERRLGYVAFTRAREGLYITAPLGFTENEQCRQPSRFLFEAGLDNFDCINEVPDYLLPAQYKNTNEKQYKFRVNDAVSHPNLGYGIVDSIIDEEGLVFYIIKFDGCVRSIPDSQISSLIKIKE